MPHPQDNWEVSFDEKFACKEENCCNGKLMNDHHKVKTIKDFIKQLLSRQRQEMVEMIEKRKITKESFNGNPDTHIRIKRGAYNKAISDVLALLKGEK